MACLTFDGGQALLQAHTTTTQLDPEVMAEANHLLETAVEAFNKQFED